MITKPLKGLTHAPPFTKLAKDQVKGIANSLIRMKNDLAQSIEGISDRKPLEQFTSARFGFLAGLHSLPKNLQLDDTERSFDAQNQLVVEIIQVIDLLLVSNERPKDLAHFYQSAPVLVRARKPGSLSTRNDSYIS